MLIDIHTHIIPFIDDGAENWEYALELLKQGEKDGIVAAVATPHILTENDYRIEKEIILKFLELKKRAKEQQLKMKLFLGSEIYAQPDMTLTHRISTINNKKRYFLVEFPMTTIPRFVAEKFFSFIVEEKIPIIAHPERNLGFYNKPNLAYEFVQRGALLQINAPSILGKHGSKAKTIAYKLISKNLAHFVASDCHNPDHRSMALRESFNVVVSHWGEKMAKLLFFENPKKVITGEKIEPLEPSPIIEDFKKMSMWQKLKGFRAR